MRTVDDKRSVLLEQLGSPSWDVTRSAIEHASELLQAGTADDDIVDRVCRAASHPKWEVRKAVAYTLLFVRDDKFDPPIARLLDDENKYVRNQANQTMSLRTVRKHADPLGREDSAIIREELEALESRYGAAARLACDRVARKRTEFIVRELHHELVTAITPLETKLERLRLESGDERTRETLEKAQTHVSRVETVIRSMLDYTTETELQPVTVHVSSLLSHAVEAVRAVSRSEFAVELPESCDLELVADFNRLSQALVNIICNAVEASSGRDQSAELRIGVDRDEVSTIFAVTDNGPGFPSFEEPVRRYATSKPHGLGFGLAEAKKIVETEHRGRLTLSNSTDGGAVVTVRIPHPDEDADAN